MTHWLRFYVGSGSFEQAGILSVDTVPEGDVLAIWMQEEAPITREEPHVQRVLDARGSLWMRCFSVIVPDGEYGWVSPDPRDISIVKVTDAAFERARERGWTLGPFQDGDLPPVEMLRLRHLMDEYEKQKES